MIFDERKDSLEKKSATNFLMSKLDGSRIELVGGEKFPSM
jgi:hypothetical protein